MMSVKKWLNSMSKSPLFKLAEHSWPFNSESETLICRLTLYPTGDNPFIDSIVEQILTLIEAFSPAVHDP
jgi:hypothetical protein